MLSGHLIWITKRLSQGASIVDIATHLNSKQRVVDECRQPNTSIAKVALRHDLNLNQVDTWRRSLGSARVGDFMRLLVHAEGEASHSVALVGSTVSIRLDGSHDTNTVDWLLHEIDCSVAWLKLLMQ